MQAVGMVAEFNPFHNGHVHYVRQAKQQTGADVAIAVMSGNFTQRGEPTVVDKWARTRAALVNGVDLVVELPIFFACQPAHRFAAGALRLLNALDVSAIAFGAEHPEWDFGGLVAAARNFDHTALKKYTETYATQFNVQLRQATGVSLTEPNDILAFAYMRAAIEGGYSFRLQPVKRIGSSYHDKTINGRIASASAIRDALATGTEYQETVPQTMRAALAAVKQVPSWDSLYPLLRNQLIQSPIAQLRQIYQMAEGLEYRMKEMAERDLTFADFIHGIKTKRYTYAHLIRLCLYTTMHMTEGQLSHHAQQPYLHILGFNRRGQEYLHQVKKTVGLPMFTKVSQAMKDGGYNLDYRAGKLYQLFTPVEQDIKHGPIIYR